MGQQSNVKTLVVQLQSALEPHGDAKIKWEILTELSGFLSEKNNHDLVTSDYCAILRLLLQALKPNLFDCKFQEFLFDEFFLKGCYHDSFIILVQRLSNSSPSYEQSKISDLLEKFIRNGNLYHMFLNQCISDDSEKLKCIGSTAYWENLIQLLTSLPDRIANRTHQKHKNIFSTKCYIPIIASTIWKVLRQVYEYLASGKDCNIEFLGRVTGKFCIAVHGGVLVKYLSVQLLKSTKEDFLWRRISCNFISKIPPTTTEMFMSHILLYISWYGYLENILGNLGSSDPKIQFLFTVKFLLVRQFKDDIILQNIIGYLASSSERKHLFFKVVKTLLDVWSDRSATRHQNSVQQLYLASALMVCCPHLKRSHNDDAVKGLIHKLLDGVQIRIASPDSLVRGMGMLVGKSLVSVLDPDAPALEYEDDLSIPELKRLSTLTELPEEPLADTCEKDILEIESLSFLLKETVNTQVTEESTIATETVTLHEPNVDIDSDDDLEPYDMSDDMPQESTTRPLYIRDCLQGLMEAEKPDWTEQCLRHAPKLIRKNPLESAEVATELAKVLLHLDDTFGMSDFLVARHRALIAITVQCPAKAASYLTQQFYERDYNIRQRLDILEVVAAASQALSNPKFLESENAEKSYVSHSESPVEKTEENWQTVINKRLEAKTRIISLGPRRRAPEPQMNIFGTVAGHFFFPLIEKFDREHKMLNLMGDDSYVLGRLLYTLGIVMHSSVNTLICRQMGSSLLKFLAVVRNHSEVFVRKAALFAITTVILTVPPFILITEFQQDVLECQQWLNDVIEKDCDADCQVKAAQAAQLIYKAIEEELPAITNEMNLR